MKKRLDQHLADEGFFESRERARAAVMEGEVRVDGSSDVKPGTRLTGGEKIVVEDRRPAYVSRGGLKLAGALEDLGLDVSGVGVLDVGASTGGFTDCLLQRGAARVIALDVGRGQLHWKLRQDARVTVIERLNARRLVPGDLPWTPGFATVDVSFISLEKVVVPVAETLLPGGRLLTLVKPQFEAGKGAAPGGVVRDDSTLREVLLSLRDWMIRQGLTAVNLTPSRIRGPKGNAEFFLLVDTTPGVQITERMIDYAIKNAPPR